MSARFFSLLIALSFISMGFVPFASALILPCFTVTPPIGYAGDVFEFDASCSITAPLSNARWDWNDDGWDTGLASYTVSVKHVFPTCGIYTVRMEIKDPVGDTASTTHQVTVLCGCINACGGTGSQRWMVDHQVPDPTLMPLHTRGTAVAAASDCGSYTAGYTHGGSTNTDVFLSRFSCDGLDFTNSPGPLWTEQYALQYREEVEAMTSIVGAAATDDVYLVGRILPTWVSYQADVLFMHYEATLAGAVLVCTAPIGNPSSWDTATDVTPAPDGTGVYVTGYRNGANFLAFYSAACVETWSVDWPTPEVAWGVAAQQSGSNVEIYVTGASNPQSSSSDVTLRKYECAAPCTATGPSSTPAWAVTWSSPYLDSGYDVATYDTGTRGVYVAAELRHGYAGLLKFDDSGNLLWSQTSDFSGDGGGFGVSVRDGGGAFLAGRHDMNGANRYQAFIAAYSPTGTLDWSHSVGGSSTDHGLGVATASDGNALMVGEFFDGAGNGQWHERHYRWCD